MRLKRITILFLLAITFSNALAQNREVDSLRSVFANEKNDSIRVVLLCRMSDEYYLYDPDSAMHYAQQGLHLAVQSELKKGQSRSLARVGNIFFSIGDFANALDAHLQALHISEEINDMIGITASNNNMALVYKEQGEYRQALEYYFKAKEAYEQMLKGLENEKKKDEVTIWRTQQNLVIVSLNIGDNYERMNQLDSALQYQSKAQNLAIMIDDRYNLGAILSNLGYVYFRKKMVPEALLSYRLSIPHLAAIDDKKFLSITNYGIAIIFQNTGPVDSSIFYGLRALNVASEGGFQREVLNAATLLTELYENKGDDKKSLFYLKLVKSTGDSIFNMAKMNQIQSLRINEKFRQQQLAESKEKIAKERKRNLQNMAILILLIPLFGIFFKVGGRNLHVKIVEILGLMGLLLLYEFISVFINPYLVEVTNDNQLYILLIHFCIAGALVTIYYPIRNWIRVFLEYRRGHRL